MVEFPVAFSKLTGHPPMRWQRRLFDELCTGDIPDAVDLPTGVGKTSVMAIWLLARALAPNAALPRRLIYVVDRRVVVDQASAEALKIAGVLERQSGDPPVDELRSGLRLCRDDLPEANHEQRLCVSTLRGAQERADRFVDSREWIYDPAASAIIVGTVDMIGSRLLMSGYRLGYRSHSMQAGLLAMDSLFVLDEAHLAPALERTVRQVLVLHGGPTDFPIPKMRLLPLSATAMKTDASKVFRLEASDYDDPVVAQRTGRAQPTKRVELSTVTDGKKALSEALAEAAARYDGTVKAVVIYCTLRETAENTAKNLRDRLKKLRNGKDEHERDVALITGVRRGHERDTLADTATYRAFTYNKDGQRDVLDERTRYLVCTSAGEVGADLDAEAAVMDLVPLERMIQRLGRVNRRGLCIGAAPVTVFYDPAALTAKNENNKDRAKRLAATKAALEGLPKLDGGHDASPCRIAEGIGDTDKEAASTPAPEIPRLELDHVEALALTSLKHNPGRPEVDKFLRGLEDDDEPQTTVAWRADVALLAALVDTGANVDRAFEVARLKQSEIVEAPSWEVVDILQARIKALQKEWKKAKDDRGESTRPLRILLLRNGEVTGCGTIGPERAVLMLAADDASSRAGSRKDAQTILLDGESKFVQRPLQGATVLLEPAMGGLNEDGLLDNCGTRTGLHVRPDIKFLHVRLPAEDGSRQAEELTTEPGQGRTAKYNRSLIDQFHGEGLERTWSAALPVLEDSEDQDGGGLEYWSAFNIDGETAVSTACQTLKDHHAEAEVEMKSLVERLKLPNRFAEVLIRVMALHDLGKDRRRWLDDIGAPRDGRPYAKVGGRGRSTSRYRHEFGSLRDILANPDHYLAGFDEAQRDLALHLIASHHGYARPFIPALDEEEIFPKVLDLDALDIALRYVRVQRRWGIWFLAWLEALVRSVDATVSRRFEQSSKGSEKQEAAE